ncbi:MAG: hypothetical protein FJ029_15565 [Actinobacteria bacterium]|nr:hypothetical protein [Actinomycetota bacterium]
MSGFGTNIGTPTSRMNRSGADAVLVLAPVPISRTIGTARSGYGCLGEDEVVMLGGEMNMAWIAGSGYAPGLLGPLRSWAIASGIPAVAVVRGRA